MKVPNPQAVSWVLLWIIYIVGLIEIGSAAAFILILAWDDFRYHRHMRRSRREAEGDQ